VCSGFFLSNPLPNTQNENQCQCGDAGIYVHDETSGEVNGAEAPLSNLHHPPIPQLLTLRNEERRQPGSTCPSGDVAAVGPFVFQGPECSGV